MPGQEVTTGQPKGLDVNLNADLQSYLPLCLLFNARSVYNKADNMAELLNQICPDIGMVSESWESERRRLSSILHNTQYKSISCYGKNRSPGGGCANLNNETRFSVTNLEIDAPEGVESIWALFTP